MVLKKRGYFWIFVALVVVLFASSIAAENGCFVYSGAADLYCETVDRAEAQAVCNGDCNINNNFFPNIDCNQQNAQGEFIIPQCEPVQCSVDCLQHPLGLCEQLGRDGAIANGQPGAQDALAGQEIPGGEEAFWCSERCCRVGNQCTIKANRWQCLVFGQERGVNQPTERIGFNHSQCAALCRQGPAQAGIITGHITENGNSVPNAIVRIAVLNRETRTDANGAYQLANVASNSYVLSVTAAGFVAQTRVIDVSSAQTVTADFALQREGGARFIATVMQDEGGRQTPLAGASVEWLEGRQLRSAVTNASGIAEITGLPANQQITFRAQKTGYSSEEFGATFAEEEQKSYVFVLTLQSRQGIRGFVLKADGTAAIGARVFANGSHIGNSRPLDAQHLQDGWFEIELPPGHYRIHADFLGQHFVSDPLTVSVEEGRFRENVNLNLHPPLDPCNGAPNPPLNFRGQVTPGKNQIQLSWDRPCENVQAYELITYDTNGQQLRRTRLPFSLFTYADSAVEWDQSYFYNLTAIYINDQYREVQSSHVRIGPLAVGDPACEGKYVNGQWQRFCRNRERQKIYSCTNENTLFEFESCPGDVQFCAPSGQGEARCKNAQCSASLLMADPFGLYYTRDACYRFEEQEGEQRPTKFCYYDYTNTIVDRCDACTTVQSCFDYKSRDACVVNSCLTDTCRWVDVGAGINNYGEGDIILAVPFTTSETGHGYCVQDNYQQEDKCTLCGKTGTLFENFYCTGEVCSALGNCFADRSVRSCSTCATVSDPQANDPGCYRYQTEAECAANGGSFAVNPDGTLQLSKDSCDLGRCRWRGGSCMKDGDADTTNDCSKRDMDVHNFKVCALDNEAPRTSILESRRIITLQEPRLTFTASDLQSNLGVLKYCFESPEGGVSCSFQEVRYAASPQDRKVVDIASSVGMAVDGQTFTLKYYSVDQYSNREALQKTTVFIDNQAPRFAVRTEANALTNQLVVWIDQPSELMSCQFNVTQLQPAGELHSESKASNEELRSIVPAPGSLYEVTVTCTDAVGNSHTERPARIGLDREGRITVVSPALNSIVVSDTIVFQATTTVPATCQLEEAPGGERLPGGNNQRFVGSNDNAIHQTARISRFLAGEYNYVIRCTATIPNPAGQLETFTDFFSFTVDFDGPQGTQIILQEGEREDRPLGRDWNLEYTSSATVRFECTAEGNACRETKYCLEDPDHLQGCDNKASNVYQLLPLGQAITIDTTQRICYYSLDEAGHEENGLTCGIIHIRGFGIHLLNPDEYYIIRGNETELWGVDNTTLMNLSIQTRVPTQECRYSFASITEENYDEARLLTQQSEELYSFDNFPSERAPFTDNNRERELHIRCTDSAGQLSPEQVIHLLYDPSVPIIRRAVAEPNPALQGHTINLTVETDDFTLCKYDEDSSEFEFMAHQFPGMDRLPPVLATSHGATYTHGGSGNYTLVTQCINGAGMLSEQRNITFVVDLSAVGDIVSVAPSGYIHGRNVTLQVITNKNARCRFTDGNGQLTLFAQTDGTSHQHYLSNLNDSTYVFPVQCTVLENSFLATREIRFTIDNQAPTITRIDDGNKTCSLSELSAFVYTNEEHISAYFFELYEKRTPLGQRLTNGTVGYNQPIRLTGLNLTPGQNYLIRVRAGDEAGNWATVFVDSDGVTAVAENETSCVQDDEPPQVRVVVNESCTSVMASLVCTDRLGCREFMHGKASNAAACSASSPYGGANILFNQTGWLCYAARDTHGNNATGKELVTFPDKDGDKISNSCDRCPGTAAGKAVGADGCAMGEISIQQRNDTDGDGLPDVWEKLFHTEQCQLNYVARDSDMDGMPDPEEDYDDDGATNYQEYIGRSDPCLFADRPNTDEEDLLPRRNESGGAPGGGDDTDVGGETNVLAWVLLILGLLFTLGGSGYLTYYYTSQGKKKSPASSFMENIRSQGIVEQVTQPVSDAWETMKQKLKSQRQQKVKQRERKNVFGEFEKK